MVAWCPARQLIADRLGRYWEDPHTFKPSRFLKDWPRDAFMPLSAGRHWNSLKKCIDMINNDSRIHQAPEHA
jgi:hypothetical protein